MDGREFFKLLRELYDPELHSYLKDNHIDPNHELGSSQWTELMGKVLEKIRVEADFDSGECKPVTDSLPVIARIHISLSDH